MSGKSGYMSYKSMLSKQSKASRISKTSRVKAGEQDIENSIAEEGNDADLECTPEDFVNCNNCTRVLSDDERIINARFVNEAIAAHRDISVFPICIACNFE